MPKRTKPEPKPRQNTKSKQDAKKYLGTVPQEVTFWCIDGRIFKNIQELGEGLVTMSDETFAGHCNQEKCDFSNWVRDVIGDQKLARDLAKVKSKVEAAKAVSDRIATLNKRLA
ncbi:MAG: hypothetical protein ABIH70_05305 [Chloroflexota bacterium]